jgi:hypothetical protein
MRLRIIREPITLTAAGLHASQKEIFRVQRRTWWGGWTAVQYWYKSDFSDMPGWWVSHFEDYDAAVDFLDALTRADRDGKNPLRRQIKVVHQE